MVFAEDDWRQFEFISTVFEADIEDEIQGVVNIYESHKDAVGFKQIHLRKKISEPLNSKSITVDDLKAYFKFQKDYKGVAFNTSQALISNGFALQDQDSWCLWGQCKENGEIETLNLMQSEDTVREDVAAVMDQFLNKYGLFLVNWPELFWAGKDHESCVALTVNNDEYSKLK